MSLQYALVGDMSWQNRAKWQTPDTPFMSFAFWQALSDTDAIGERAGWLPIFVLIYHANETASRPKNNDIKDGIKKDDATDDLDKKANEIIDTQIMQPVAVMPVFVKGHHRGEFVFDYAWAQAYARYGMDYYPRLVTSSPYTPITGQRIWLTVGAALNTEIIQAAMRGVDDIAQQVGASSWHGLFVTSELANLAASSDEEIKEVVNHSMKSEDNALATIPTLERQGCQFLWQNNNLAADNRPFADFDDFLMTLKAKKRKTIRAERRKVAEQGIECIRKCGDDITDSDWKAFYHCYVMTYAVRGQQPYLTMAFFMALADSMPENIMLAQAFDSNNEIIASSLFLYDVANSSEDDSKKDNKTTLYGRYWGALADYDSLHFELCYYQGIEFAIEQGLMYFDPGTQGEHKLIRGFIPTKTHSLHRIYDARFIPAIANFCRDDRLRMAQYRQQAYDALPFNIDNMPDPNLSI